MMDSHNIALIFEADGSQAVTFKIAARTEGLAPIWIRDADAAIRYLCDRAPPRLLIIGLSSPGDPLSVLRALRTKANVYEAPALACSNPSALRERPWTELGISQLIACPASIETVQKAI